MHHSESFVFFDETDVVRWENVRIARLAGQGIADVWRINVPLYMDSIPQLYKVLSVDEKNNVSRLYQKKDQHRFIVGKAILRTLLGSYLDLNPETINFTFGLYKKPAIRIGEKIPLHFNVSHSGNYILIAFADKPIGVDVEYSQPDLTINEIAKVTFSKAEIAFMNNQITPREAFFKLWTRKEALLKATSKGLSNDIKYIPCLNGRHAVHGELLNSYDRWRVSSFNVDEKHIGSIAYLRNTREVRFKQFIYNSTYNFA